MAIKLSAADVLGLLENHQRQILFEGKNISSLIPNSSLIPASHLAAYSRSTSSPHWYAVYLWVHHQPSLGCGVGFLGSMTSG